MINHSSYTTCYGSPPMNQIQEGFLLLQMLTLKEGICKGNRVIVSFVWCAAIKRICFLNRFCVTHSVLLKCKAPVEKTTAMARAYTRWQYWYHIGFLFWGLAGFQKIL